MEKKTLPQDQLPVMTLTPTELRFTSACSETLGGLHYVYFLIHPYKKHFLLLVGRHGRRFFDCPPTRWTEDLEHDNSGAVICRHSKLPERMYSSWGLDRKCIYWAVGVLDSLEELPLLLFDFDAAEKCPCDGSPHNTVPEEESSGN